VVGAIIEEAGRSHLLLRPYRRVYLMGWVPPRLGGARAAGHRARTGRLLIFSDRASR
jgi:hypothetical protein